MKIASTKLEDDGDHQNMNGKRKWRACKIYNGQYVEEKRKEEKRHEYWSTFVFLNILF